MRKRGWGCVPVCRHARVVTARVNNRYYLCGRAAVDTRFPKYPCLPVLACDGYERTPSALEARRRA